MKKWYSRRTATEKGALITGGFVLVAALLTILHQRSQLKEENTILTQEIKEARAEIQRLCGERAALASRLAPFEAIAAKSFPNQDDRQRLDLLIQSIDELNRKYGSFELRRADALTLTKRLQEFATAYEAKHAKKPEAHIILYSAATDASGQLFEQVRRMLADTGWDADVKVETMGVQIERGLYVYTPGGKPSEHFNFWVKSFMDFGLNVKVGTWSQQGMKIDDDEAVIVINDPSYIK